MSSQKVRFCVVVFNKENTIAVVPASWVEEVDGVLICYWPHKNAAALAKTSNRPDKELWSKYKIRILSETDDYKTAKERVKRAIETSNVESDEEMEKVQKKKVTSRYWTGSKGYENSPTGSHIPEVIRDCEMPQKKMRKMSTSSVNPAPTLPKPPSYKPLTDITLTAHTPDEDEPSLNNLSADDSVHENIDNTQPTSQAECAANADFRQLLKQSEQRILLALERMQTDIAHSIEHLVQAIQQNHPGPASITTLPQETIERPCKTVQELQALTLKLEGPEEKRRMIHFLSLLGGSSIGDTVRRILRKVATNEAWANYSLKGRKGKLPFIGMTLHHIVLSACAKQFPKITEKEIETCIGETLKHAPHRTKVVTTFAEEGLGEPPEDGDNHP